MSYALCPNSVSLLPLSPKYIPPVSSLTTHISNPSPIISAFKGEESFKGSKSIPGLIFAYKPNSFLRPKIALSGLLSEGSLSHFTPPTAPSRMESLDLHTSIVSLGSGSPYTS